METIGSLLVQSHVLLKKSHRSEALVATELLDDEHRSANATIQLAPAPTPAPTGNAGENVGRATVQSSAGSESPKPRVQSDDSLLLAVWKKMVEMVRDPFVDRLELSLVDAVYLVLDTAILCMVLYTLREKMVDDQRRLPQPVLGRNITTHGDLPDRGSILGMAVEYEDCDMVIIFPVAQSRQDQEEAEPRLRSSRRSSSMAGMLFRSFRLVNGVKLAQKLFEDPIRQKFPWKEVGGDDSELEKFDSDWINNYFTEDMPLEDYKDTVRMILADLFASKHFGLDIQAFTSIDGDEHFWMVWFPEDVVKQVATIQRYRMPITDDAYARAKIPWKAQGALEDARVPRNDAGNPVYAYTSYMKSRFELFQGFSSSDRFKLLSKQIDNYVSMETLREQNVVNTVFVPHSHAHVEAFSKKWANPWVWHRFTAFVEHENRIRRYFGEQLTWIYIWQDFYKNALLVPALFGLFMCFQKYFFKESVQHLMRLVLATVMAVWAALFNARWEDHEARVSQRWGMDALKPTAFAHKHYRSNKQGSWQVRMAYWATDILTFVMVFGFIVGVNRIEELRDIGHKFPSVSPWAWQQMIAITTSIFIMAVDVLWQYLAGCVVSLENHKFQDSHEDRLIKRLFMVRIVINMYPFLYIAFLEDKCPKTDRGCLDILDRSVYTYFIMRMLQNFGRDLAHGLTAWLRIANERLRVTGTGVTPEHMYIQIQAKLSKHGHTCRMDDWSRQVISFLLLSCFNVVIPIIAPLVLLTVMLEAKLLPNRDCNTLRRPTPIASAGIGPWKDLLNIVEHLAVLVNVMFVCFKTLPVRDYPLQWKFWIFVVAEHALICIKYLAKQRIANRARDVTEIHEHNEHVIRRLCHSHVATLPASKRVKMVSPSSLAMGKSATLAPHGFSRPLLQRGRSSSSPESSWTLAPIREQ